MAKIRAERRDEIVEIASECESIDELVTRVSALLGNHVRPETLKRRWREWRQERPEIPKLSDLLESGRSLRIEPEAPALTIPRELRPRKLKDRYGNPHRADYDTTGEFWMMVSSDHHYPMADPAVEAIMLAMARDLKPRYWLVLGDLYDFWMASRFMKSPASFPDNFLQDELDSAQPFWQEAAKICDRIALLLGNHENRLHAILTANPALLKLRALDFARMAELPDNVDVFGYGTRLRVGTIPMVFEHGDKVGGRYGAKHPAKAYAARYGAMRSSAFGHHHRMETLHVTTYTQDDQPEDRIIVSLGTCVSIPSAWDWYPLSGWQNGFMIMRCWQEGKKTRFQPYPVQVVRGQCSFLGKVYRG